MTIELIDSAAEVAVSIKVHLKYIAATILTFPQEIVQSFILNLWEGKWEWERKKV